MRQKLMMEIKKNYDKLKKADNKKRYQQQKQYLIVSEVKY